MGASSSSRPELARALDSRLLAAGGDPYAVLADLLGGAEVAEEGEVLSLHGRVLDGLRLGRILGTGGMGVTYAGVDERGERVAVKILGRLSEPEQERFSRECTIVQALDHQNLVRYRRHGITPGGTPFLVMDIVEGDDLDTLLGAIERGDAHGEAGEALVAGLAPDVPVHAQPEYQRRVLRLLAAVADGLHHAHVAGIVHRDVKPANVVVRPDLTPVLVDFGLARDLFQDVSWTRSGAAVGTVGWMAPEQLEGDLAAVGPRTDVFALGLLLHRALTGRELRRDLRDLLRFRRGRLVLEKEDVEGLAREVVAVLYGCLEPDPERRYPSAKALADDLRAVFDGGRPRRRVPGWIARVVRRRGFQVAVGAVACGVAGTLAAVLWPRLPYVTITCLEDDQNGRVRYADGSEFFGNPRLPLADLRVPHGTYDLVYRSPRIGDLPFRLVVDRPLVRLDLLNVPRGELLRMPKGPVHYAGKDAAVLDLTTYADGAELRIDGEAVAWSIQHTRSFPGDVELAASRARLALAPGVHTIAVSTSDGRREEQSIELLRGRFVPAILLGRRLGDVPASYRYTWASVLTAPPPGVGIELAGAAGTFMDAMGLALLGEQPEIAPLTGLIHHRRLTCLTGLADDVPGVAVLTVGFPEPMRSVLAVVHAKRLRDADGLTIEWRLDGGGWNPCENPPVDTQLEPEEIPGLWRVDPRHYQAIDVAELPAPGVRSLQIRFTMQPRQRPYDTTTVQVLGSYVNELGVGHATPALEVVAHRDPSPRRRR